MLSCIFTSLKNPQAPLKKDTPTPPCRTKGLRCCPPWRNPRPWRNCCIERTVSSHVTRCRRWLKRRSPKRGAKRGDKSEKNLGDWSASCLQNTPRCSMFVWFVWYIFYLHEWLGFYGFHVGKYLQDYTKLTWKPLSLCYFPGATKIRHPRGLTASLPLKMVVLERYFLLWVPV